MNRIRLGIRSKKNNRICFGISFFMLPVVVVLLNISEQNELILSTQRNTTGGISSAHSEAETAPAAIESNKSETPIKYISPVAENSKSEKNDSASALMSLSTSNATNFTSSSGVPTEKIVGTDKNITISIEENKKVVAFDGTFVIIDCIMYNGEPIVLTRLEILNETVDHFYITEAAVTFAGVRKPFLFKDLHADMFKPYEDKITWSIYEPPADWEGKPGMAWIREGAIRNHVLKTIRNDVEEGVLPPRRDDIVLVNTDADEIPAPQVLDELRPGKKWHAKLLDHPLHLEMTFFYFNYNWKYGTWFSGNVVSGRHALAGEDDKLTKVRKMDGKRQIRIPNAGYHLSYGFSVDDIVRKIESFSHQEFNTPRYKSREHIMRSIENEEELFYRREGGRMVHYDYKQLPVPLQRLHIEVCKSQNVSPDDGKRLSPGLERTKNVPSP